MIQQLRGVFLLQTDQLGVEIGQRLAIAQPRRLFDAVACGEEARDIEVQIDIDALLLTAIDEVIQSRQRLRVQRARGFAIAVPLGCA